MKRKSFLLIVLVISLLQGCLIKSLHPFFKNKDIKYYPELIGEWIDQDSLVWTIQQTKYPKGFLKEDTLVNSYLITIDEESVFTGTLFKLNGIYYLDFFPEMGKLFDGEFYSWHLMPTHSLAKIEFLKGGKVQISWFNEEWLAKLFKQNKVKISHEKVEVSKDEEPYVLTASTEELQKFIIKYGDNPEIYQCDNEGVCSILSKIK